MTDTCSRCGERSLDSGHEPQCAAEYAARDAAVAAGIAVGVAEVPVVDLWAHLRSGARHAGQALDVAEAAQVVRLVLDLGWRPAGHPNPSPEKES